METNSGTCAGDPDSTDPLRTPRFAEHAFERVL